MAVCTIKLSINKCLNNLTVLIAIETTFCQNCLPIIEKVSDFYHISS